MKLLCLTFFFSGILFFHSSFEEENKVPDKINTLTGNISYIDKFGKFPDKNTNEKIRIQTHLQFVETMLKNKNVDYLSEDLKLKRIQLLNYLDEYRIAGNFPSNYDYPGKRLPCFIDKTGNICAVGYLIEKSSGREVAEKINAKYQYEYLLEMNDPMVNEWISSSGLTAQECAMIQPGYSYKREEPDPDPIDTKDTKIEIKSDTVLKVVDEVALFPGDSVFNGSKMRNFIYKNIKYPDLAKEAGIQGTVYVEFVVKKDSTVFSPVIKKTAHTLLDYEALRVVKLFPKWTPAKIAGVPVDSYVTIPVKFYLN